MREYDEELNESRESDWHAAQCPPPLITVDELPDMISMRTSPSIMKDEFLVFLPPSAARVGTEDCRDFR